MTLIGRLTLAVIGALNEGRAVRCPNCRISYNVMQAKACAKAKLPRIGRARACDLAATPEFERMLAELMDLPTGQAAPAAPIAAPCPMGCSCCRHAPAAALAAPAALAASDVVDHPFNGLGFTRNQLKAGYPEVNEART